MNPGDRVVYSASASHLDPDYAVMHSRVQGGRIESGHEVPVCHGEVGVVQDGRLLTGDATRVVQFSRGVAYVNVSYLRLWVPDLKDLKAVEAWLVS